MIDTAKLRALVADAALDARRLPLTVVLEDGANPDGGYSWHLVDRNGMFVGDSLSRVEAEAIAAAVNGAGPLLDELEALRVDRADANTFLTADALEMTKLRNERGRAFDLGAERYAAVTVLCWFLRWVLDEDERRALIARAVEVERVVDIALAEARDEGHAAGRAEALEHIKAVAADHYEAGHFHEAEVLGYAIRALAGKL